MRNLRNLGVSALISLALGLWILPSCSKLGTPGNPAPGEGGSGADTFPLRIEIQQSSNTQRFKAVILVHTSSGQILKRFDLDPGASSATLVIPKDISAYLTAMQHVKRHDTWPKEGDYDYYVAETYPIKLFAEDSGQYLVLSSWGWVWPMPSRRVPNGGFNGIAVEGECPSGATHLSVYGVWWPPFLYGLVDLPCDDSGNIQGRRIYPFTQNNGKVSVILWGMDPGWKPTNPPRYAPIWDQNPDSTVTLSSANYQSAVVRKQLKVVGLPDSTQYSLEYMISGMRYGVPTFGFQGGAEDCSAGYREACGEAILADVLPQFEAFRRYAQLKYWGDSTFGWTMRWVTGSSIPDNDTWDYSSNFAEPFADVNYDPSNKTITASGGANLASSRFLVGARTTQSKLEKYYWVVYSYGTLRSMTLSHLPADLAGFLPSNSEDTLWVSAKSYDFDVVARTPPPPQGRGIALSKLIKHASTNSVTAEKYTSVVPDPEEWLWQR